MSENMKHFLAKLSADVELAKKAAMLDKDALIALAKELGFDLTDADFAKTEGELNENELKVVAGGKACYCVMGGGGEADSQDDVCACVAYGQGHISEDSNYTLKRGGVRCVCVLGGGGTTAEEWGTETIH